MNNMARRYKISTIQACRNKDPLTDINILLLGQTGIGKTTFINGLANYLCNDTLEDAARDQMQLIIQSSFSFNFEEKIIYIGENNEPFRYLTLRRHEIQLNEEQKLSYQKSWNHTIQQYSNLMAFVVPRLLPAVCNTLSLNEAKQLVRKLTCPIIEITRLIEQNLQLAKKNSKDISKNPELASKGLPQKDAKSEHLKYSTTICTNKKCCRTVIVNNETKIEPLSKYHELTKQILSYLVGICSKYGCLWNDHQHITYDVKTDIRYLNETLLAADITKRINNLKEEKKRK
ncbi:unnamed protein product [Rotaria sordida]|uniref:G domain-containing protein n=2 Tax=Rotaria sordida TaxID=392033 RepID=A0A815UCX2_9BILA|nr:unnamed protein product [Rotaria sordida]CAF1514516.1 unnamed protein product [Rotaria sordida]